MRDSELNKIAKQLQQAFGDFEVRGRLMFLRPTRPILRGMFLDRTGYDKQGFILFRFVLPLYVPRDELHFHFGGRVRSASSGLWRSDSVDLLPDLTIVVQDVVLPFLQQIDSPKKLNDWLLLERDLENPNAAQSFAFTLARMGKFEEAASRLDVLVNNLGSSRGWEEKMRHACAVLHDLISENPGGVLQQLLRWEVETAEKLQVT